MTGGSRNRVQLVSRGPFARLWWASVVSSAGDWISLFATLALGHMIAGSFGVLLTLLSRLIPGLIFTPVGGVVADRLDRKRTMVISDVGRAFVVLLLIFVNDLPSLFAVSFLLEMLALIRQPAREAVVPRLVSRGELVGANSLSLLSAYGMLPVGAVSWFFFSKLPDFFEGLTVRSAWVAGYLTDSLTFVISALLVMTLSLPAPNRDRVRSASGIDWRAPLRDLGDGVRFVVGHRGIRIIIAGMAAALFGGGAFFALGQSFSAELLGGNNAGFAVLGVAIGAGLMTGVALVSVIGRLNIHRMLLFAFSLVTTGASILALAVVETVGGAAIWVFGTGFGAGMSYVMGITYVHERTEDEIRGRTFAALFAVARTALIGSMTIATFAAELADGRWDAPFDNGIRVVLMAGGLIVIVTGVVTLWTTRELFFAAPPSAPEGADT